MIFCDIAVYLPTEDAWIAGVMPKEKQFIWAWGYYEMRYVYFPKVLDGYNPAWINGEFVEKAIVKNGLLKVGNAQFDALYVDAGYIEYKVIKRLLELAGSGLKIILKKTPKEPGAIPHPDYLNSVNQLKRLKNVSFDLPYHMTPFISGDIIPHHWCRKDGEALYIFFPNPKAERIKFPLEYGQSLNSKNQEIKINLHYDGA
jgi:hypothetical protein